MERRNAIQLAAAIAVGAAALVLSTPGEAVGNKSAPGLQGNDRIVLCHEGKVIKVYADELDDHLAHGDFVGKCPRP